MNEAAAAEGPTTKLPTNVKLLGLASLLNDVASEMIFPLLPQFFLGVLHGDKSLLGLMEGLADSIGSLLRLWSGAWSDRAGWCKRVCRFRLRRDGAGAAAGRHRSRAVATHRHSRDRPDSARACVRPRATLIADSTDPAIAVGRLRLSSGDGSPRRGDRAAVGDAVPAALAATPADTVSAGGYSGPAAWHCLSLVFAKSRPKNCVPKITSDDQAVHVAIPALFRRAGAVHAWQFSDAFVLVPRKNWASRKPTAALVVRVSRGQEQRRSSGRAGQRPPWPAASAHCRLGALWAAYLAFAFAANAWQGWLIFLAYGFIYSLTEGSKAFVGHLTASERKGLAFGWFNFAVGIAALPSSLIFGWLYQQFGGLVAFGWGAAMAIYCRHYSACHSFTAGEDDRGDFLIRFSDTPIPPLFLWR